MRYVCRAMALAALPLSTLAATQAQAQTAPAGAGQAYPAKSVRVIASVLPGDTCDLLVRMVGYKMGERLGQQSRDRLSRLGHMSRPYGARTPGDRGEVCATCTCDDHRGLAATTIDTNDECAHGLCITWEELRDAVSPAMTTCRSGP